MRVREKFGRVCETERIKYNENEFGEKITCCDGCIDGCVVGWREGSTDGCSLGCVLGSVIGCDVG